MTKSCKECEQINDHFGLRQGTQCDLLQMALFSGDEPIEAIPHTKKQRTPQCKEGRMPLLYTTLPVLLVQLAHCADLYTSLLSKPDNVPPIEVAGGINNYFLRHGSNLPSSRPVHAGKNME